MENVEMEVLIRKLNSNVRHGLDDEEVIKRQEKYGKNVLKKKKRKSLFGKILEQLTDILILILIAAAIISFIIDSKEWIESLIILIVVILNTILGVFQENKAEKSLDALMNLSSPTCIVLRNGAHQTIDSKDVVIGDIVFVTAGNYIPADGKIIESSNLMIDESALTGESIPVYKKREDSLYSSTYVTKGQASFLVCDIGMNTEIGKIASMIDNHKEALTPLQNKLSVVGKWIGILAIFICILVFILEMLSNMTALDAFKTAIALAVAAIPEGLASVVTIVLALGVERMVKKNAIIKKLPAVETLGSCNVICSDKTGTLTQNKMEIQRMYTRNGEADFKNLSYSEKEVLGYGNCCCNLVYENHKWIGDATELAIVECKNKYAKEFPILEKIYEIPFDSERKMMTVLCKYNEGYIQITKGAPDLLLKKCKKSFLVDQTEQVLQSMAKDSLRILGIAIKKYSSLPILDNSLENHLEFIGIVGMIDPPRPEVKESILIAKEAGIKTVMITGDYITNAICIAKSLGILESNSEAISSIELNKMSDQELQNKVNQYSVYARVTPKDKARIVEAWQLNHKVVAMTGDGINDAPALKKADIGCAMGISGTDVSKEAADMILADDNFTTIVEAVKEGRGVYENIKKCIQYLLSSNIGEVLTILLASILAMFNKNFTGVPLKPVHLLWINLITDSLPAFGLGMEKPSEDVMVRSPKGKDEGFFSNKLGIKIVFEGILIGFLTLFSYLIGIHLNNERTGQTMAFVTLSTCQLFHSFNVKSKKSIFNKETFNNKFLNFSFFIGFALQLLIIYVPYLNHIFDFEAIHIEQLIISIVLSSIIILWMELGKIITKKKS